MPKHYGKPAGYKNTNASSTRKVKMPKPVGRARKELTKGQKELMLEHKQHHTAKHMTEMRKLMKKGYCFQQAHDITMKKIGK